MRCAFVKKAKARVIISFMLSILSSNVLAGSFHVRKTLLLRSIFSLRSGGGKNKEKIELDAEVSSTSSNVSKTMYNKQATKWVRTKPRCLSDFTGRPVVFEMLSATNIVVSKSFPQKRVAR